MIRIFYDDCFGKVNFVDDNNKFVGFSVEQQCCESFDYYIRGEIPFDAGSLRERAWNGGELYELEGYHFSGKYDVDEYDNPSGDYDNSAMFELVSDAGKPNLYLVITNVHNGWYHHGFIFQDGNDVIVEGEV